MCQVQGLLDYIDESTSMRVHCRLCDAAGSSDLRQVPVMTFCSVVVAVLLSRHNYHNSKGVIECAAGSACCDGFSCSCLCRAS